MNTAHNRLSHADRIQGAIKSLCELGIAIRPVYIYYPHDMFNPTAVICSFSFLFFNFFSYLYIIEGSVARRVDARNQLQWNSFIGCPHHQNYSCLWILILNRMPTFKQMSAGCTGPSPPCTLSARHGHGSFCSPNASTLSRVEWGQKDTG